MRQWLIKILGGVSKTEAVETCNAYNKACSDMLENTVNKHNMQSAWEQCKQERKQARLH